MTSMTLGNTGTQLKIKTPLFLKKIYQTTLLIIDQSIKKRPANTPNTFKFQNNKCSISDHSRTSFMKAGYDLHVPFPSVFNKETQTFSRRSKSNLYLDAPELLSKKHSARDGKLLTVASGQFKLCTYLNSN